MGSFLRKHSRSTLGDEANPVVSGSPHVKIEFANMFSGYQYSQIFDFLKTHGKFFPALAGFPDGHMATRIWLYVTLKLITR